MRKILYLGFLGFNNLGDEVCYETFLQRLAHKSNKEKYHVMPYDLRNKVSVAQIAKAYNISDVVIGGGSLLQGTVFINLALEAIALKLPLWIYGTGIDYLDEGFAKCLKQGGFPCLTAPFENKEIKIQALQAIFDYSQFCGVRGPMTLHFLRQNCKINSKIQMIGDAGLVYKPKRDNSILDMLKYQQDKSGRIVAINWGNSLNSIFGHNNEQVRHQLAQYAKQLIGNGFRIVIYPMWENDIADCRKLHDDIGNPSRCTLIPKISSIDSVCWLLKKARFSINFKLHANILSALVNTPFISLAYRSKCYDFALSLKLYDHCISTADTHIAARIAYVQNRIALQRRTVIKGMKRCKRLYAKRHDQFFDQFWNSIKD